MSSFSSTEKKSILNKLRCNFAHIQDQMNSKSEINVELTQLLSDVADKLDKMEAMEDEAIGDYEEFTKTMIGDTNKPLQSSEELDPIEKVAKWRKEVQKTSTGYNSYSTSPTPGSGIKHSERSASFDQGSSPVELDR